MGKAGAWAKCMSAVMHGSTGYRAGMAQWGRPACERSAFTRVGRVMRPHACARRVRRGAHEEGGPLFLERFSTAAVGAAADLEVAWGRRTPRGAMLARTGSGEPAAQDGSRRRDWFWRARLIATRGRGRDHSVVQGIPCSTSYGMVDRLPHDTLLDAIGTVSLHSQGASRSPPQKEGVRAGGALHHDVC